MPVIPIFTGMFTTAHIDKMVEEFSKGTLPKPAWTHEAHIAVASWFLMKFPLEKAIPLIREGIKTYNVSAGGVNTDTDGYHETITLFWIIKIHEFKNAYPVITDIGELVNRMLDGEFSNSSYPFVYYTKPFLMSVEARKNWLPPDVKMMWVPDEI